MEKEALYIDSRVKIKVIWQGKDNELKSLQLYILKLQSIGLYRIYRQLCGMSLRCRASYKASVRNMRWYCKPFRTRCRCQRSKRKFCMTET